MTRNEYTKLKEVVEKAKEVLDNNVNLTDLLLASRIMLNLLGSLKPHVRRAWDVHCAHCGEYLEHDNIDKQFLALTEDDYFELPYCPVCGYVTRVYATTVNECHYEEYDYENFKS